MILQHWTLRKEVYLNNERASKYKILMFAAYENLLLIYYMEIVMLAKVPNACHEKHLLELTIAHAGHLRSL